jgi:hypothetical protein
VANQPPVSLQLQLHVDPTVALKTKAMPAKKQLVRPKKLRWPKPVRCASKQILAMFQQDVRRTQEASAKSKRRDMTGFAQMPFSEQMEYLSTKGKEGTGFKTKEGSTRKKDEMGDYTPFKKGGTVSSASKRADGIAVRGKTRCKVC